MWFLVVFGNGNIWLIFFLFVLVFIILLFGWREYLVLGYRKFYIGIDLGVLIGILVVVIYVGKVAIVDWLGGYGVVVVLDY